MITKQLSVGDYIFQANGSLARITKINKNTYTYTLLAGNGSGNVYFNGIKNGYWESEDWFECDNATAKALELAFKRYNQGVRAESDLKEAKKIIGKAKYLLEQLADFDSVEVEEDE